MLSCEFGSCAGHASAPRSPVTCAQPRSYAASSCPSPRLALSRIQRLISMSKAPTRILEAPCIDGGCPRPGVPPYHLVLETSPPLPGSVCKRGFLATQRLPGNTVRQHPGQPRGCILKQRVHALRHRSDTPDFHGIMQQQQHSLADCLRIRAMSARKCDDSIGRSSVLGYASDAPLERYQQRPRSLTQSHPAMRILQGAGSWINNEESTDSKHPFRYQGAVSSS